MTQIEEGYHAVLSKLAGIQKKNVALTARTPSDNCPHVQRDRQRFHERFRAALLPH